MTLSEKLKPGTTALIIIDMQNDFCAPRGVMGRMGKDVTGVPTLVKRQQALVDVCRSKEIPVLFTQQIYDRTKLTDLQKEQYDLDGKLVTCDITGNGWKFFGFEPDQSQIYPKYKIATTSTDLETQPRTLSVVQKTYGLVTSSSEVIKVLQEATGCVR